LLGVGPALQRRQRHNPQARAPGDHAHHPIKAIGPHPGLQAKARVQGLFLQVHRQGAVGGQADIVVRQTVDKTHCAGRQRVAHWQDQHQWIIAKRSGLQAVGVHRVGNDPQVRRTLAQGMGDAQAGQLLQVDIKVGVRAEKIRQ